MRHCGVGFVACKYGSMVETLIGNADFIEQ
jgi:hypothetical protein